MVNKQNKFLVSDPTTAVGGTNPKSNLGGVQKIMLFKMQVV